MERRLLVAVVLSSAVLFSYPLLLAKIYPNYSKNIGHNPPEAPALQAKLAVTQVFVPPLEQPEAEPPATHHRMEGQEVSVTYSDRSGGIQKLTLPQYQDLDSQQPVTLLSARGLSEELLTLVTEDAQHESHPLVKSYHAEYNEDTAKFSAVTASGVHVEKEIKRAQHNPVSSIAFRFTNTTDHAQNLTCQVVIGIQPLSGTTKSSSISPLEAIAVSGDRIFKVSQPAVLKKPKHYQGPLTHLALVERHFGLIAYTPQGFDGVTVVSASDGLGLQARVHIDRNLAAHETHELAWKLYAGPRDFEHVKAAGQHFEEVFHLGFLGQIGLLLLTLLKWINVVVHNYGVAIILLTVLVSLLLAPFNLMSLRSMQRMKAIQPLADAMRAKHKDNTEKFNKEYMALLKKHHVNPLAGCLVPLLIQMPIFFALLSVLSNSIELRGARFLWVRDLSAPDMLVRMPFSLPFFGNQLNLLPLVTIVAMYVQQKMSQASLQQTKPEGMPDLSLMMLVMFGVWMYHAPSGPVIYWLTNTVIMIVWFRAVNLKPVVLEG